MLWLPPGGHLSRAVSDAVTFSPGVLAPALWLAADDFTTLWQEIAGTTPVSADAQTVGMWQDKSGNDFHLTATADTTVRPTYNTAGFPHVTFDGTNDILRNLTSLGMYAAGACTIAMAIKANPSTARVIVGESWSSTNIPFLHVAANTVTATAAEFFIRNDVSSLPANGIADTAGAFDNTDRVLVVVDNGSNCKMYLDGVLVGNTNYTRSGTVTVDQFSIGAFFGAGTAANFANILFYQLIIVNREINVQERADLTTYLGAKIGVVL